MSLSMLAVCDKIESKRGQHSEADLNMICLIFGEESARAIKFSHEKQQQRLIKTHIYTTHTVHHDEG